MPAKLEPQVQIHSNLQLRSAVEDFLYKEAELLDEWRLTEWLELFSEDAVIKIPPLADPMLATTTNSLFIVFDDMKILRSRVQQLLGGTAWAENPHSKLRRLIANVRVTEIDEQTVCTRANFHVHKSRRGQVSNFFGEYRYRLLRHVDGFRIIERTAILSHDDFSQGYLSFIL
jgi:p-cumate 2,3-dioxygenase subunit beta